MLNAFGSRVSSTICADRDLQHVQDAARILAGLQQLRQRLQRLDLALAQDRVGQFRGFLLVHRLLVAQHRQFGLADAAIRHGAQRLALDHHLDVVAGDFVGRIPARPDGDIERAGVDHVMRVVPAQRVADFDRGAGAIGLVAGRVGAVVQQPVLHIHQAGEAHLGQDLLAFGGVLHQPEEQAVGVDDLAAMHLGHPVVQPLLQRAGLRDRLLVRPVDDRRRRGLDLAEVAAVAGVVAGRLVDLLVPDIQAGRDVPDGLRHRQHRQVLTAASGSG